MFWNVGLSKYLTELLIKECNHADVVKWKITEKEIISQVHEILSAELEKEKELDKEVNNMLDELEKTNSGQFERYKMFPLLKKKLAKKQGVIL